MSRSGIRNGSNTIFAICLHDKDYYNKGTTVEKITRYIELADKYGIISVSGFIIGAPIEKRRHFEQNKKFMREVPLDFANINILRFTYPSEIWKEAYRNGLISKNDKQVPANEKLTNF